MAPLALLLWACVPDRGDVGVRRVEDEDALVFYIPVCGDDRLTRLEVEYLPNGAGTSEGDTILVWGTRAERQPRVRSQVAFGVVMDGYLDYGVSSFDELATSYGEKPLVVTAATTGKWPLTHFVLDDLPADGSVWYDGRAVPLADIQTTLADECEPFGGAWLPVAAAIAVYGGMAVYVVGVPWYWVRSRRRRRALWVGPPGS